MLKPALLASLALVGLAPTAEARTRSAPACVETGTPMIPSCNGQDFLAGIRSIHVTMHRDRPSRHKAQKPASNDEAKWDVPSFGVPTPSFGYSVARPLRYISGRLICAINVNSALAERGIRGTGSALAHSFDHWGIRVAGPVVGAVAVTDRRGGGHVAIISRVEGDRAWAWNPSPRGRGWREVEYTKRRARYRIAG